MPSAIEMPSLIYVVAREAVKLREQRAQRSAAGAPEPPWCAAAAFLKFEWPWTV